MSPRRPQPFRSQGPTQVREACAARSRRACAAGDHTTACEPGLAIGPGCGLTTRTPTWSVSASSGTRRAGAWRTADFRPWASSSPDLLTSTRTARGLRRAMARGRRCGWTRRPSTRQARSAPRVSIARRRNRSVSCATSNSPSRAGLLLCRDRPLGVLSRGTPKWKSLESAMPTPSGHQSAAVRMPTVLAELR